jgi:NAD(P)-dependent dehydrogenase (short-subunit alcohol dehydrogenase family)
MTVSQSKDKRAIYPSLEGRRVLITGGGSGIGAGLVEGFVHQGCDVVFFDIADEESQALVTGLAAKNLRYERVDLTDVSATQATIRRLIDEGGAFDVLVNNAGNDDRHKWEEVTEEYWDRRLDVNLKHHFFCTQAVAPAMKSKGGGVVINFGSISWHLGLPELAVYQTAKAAIEGLTRALARELGPDGIRVNCVVPGNVRTPRQLRWYTPEGEAEIVGAQCLSGRLAPEDVAAFVLFLASDDARLMTGHELFIDAGWR